MKTPAPSSIKTLIVLRFSALGDVALIIPVLQAFSLSYPDVRIIICTRPRFAPLFETLKNVDILPADLEGEHKGIVGLYRLYKCIRGAGPIAILDLHNVLRTKILKLYNRLYTIPFYELDKGRAEKRQLIRSNRKVWRPLKHTTQRYADVFDAAGFPVVLGERHILPTRPVRDKDLKRSLDGNTLIGIAPFASFSFKTYKLDQLEEVVAWLDKKPNCKILIFGGGKEEQRRVQGWEEQYSNCMNLIGKYDFAEELNLISGLNLMLGMDSGNGHLSAIYGVPTLTLWGVTHPYAGFAPFGQPESNNLLADRSQYPAIPTSVSGNRCPDGYQNAINTISVSQIKHRIEEVLGWKKDLNVQFEGSKP